MPSPLRLFVHRVPGRATREAPALALANSGRRALGTLGTLSIWAVTAWLLLSLLLALTPRAEAQLIENSEAKIEYQDGGFELATSFDFDLPPALEDALHKGIPLYFVVEFQLSRPRWYWFDEKPVNTNRSVRLSYQPLTRQYRVSTGGLQLPFNRLKGALQFIQQVRGWRVFERGDVRRGETYHAELRMRLDLSQLPKPFQINAVNTREWNLSSEWKRFNYTVPTNLDAPQPLPPPPAPMPASPPAAPPAPPAAPAIPGSAPAAASAPSADARTPFSQTVSTVLSPSQLVQPASSPP
ncbi:protein of unknown function [Cupriavidus sp. OV038]|jgi:hypothetical protein|uniref:DUF4390 domain-containing protein n=1 Tax=unclassified Cupriavidus TaxID=2640874 RepID=UPI0008DEC3C4|nr:MULTISPECIES: DUF4390 domain-containing protein [unclassified Cupriavidus]SFC67612.1 protein of unknown function [Cupriavidus sp. OV038]SFO71960.1 protein of unknown function [Cupriavidus sp. OV096]